MERSGIAELSAIRASLCRFLVIRSRFMFRSFGA
jgi:hypothetical protein